VDTFERANRALKYLWWVAFVILLGGCSGTGRDLSHVDAGGSPAPRGIAAFDDRMSIEEHSAVPELDASATLFDYLAYAALCNPGLEAAFHRWRAAVEKADYAGMLPDPRFTYAYYITEVETRVGPQRQRFGLAQTVPWFGKLDKRSEVAGEEAAATRRAFEVAKIELFQSVKEACIEYAYVLRALAITDENRRLAVGLEEVARAQYQVGRAPYSSVIRAQVELGVLEERQRTLEDLLAPVGSRLNAALNRRSDLPLPRNFQIPEKSLHASEEELRQMMLRESPDLSALEHRIAREERALELARKESWPDLTFGVDYIDTAGASMPGVEDSGKDPLIAKLSLSLPFLSPRYGAMEREAGHRRRSAARELIDRRNVLLAELSMALYRWRDGERKIDLYRQTLLPKAEQSLQATQTAFETGGAGFLDLIDAQRIRLEFGLSLVRALADRALALAHLERLVGGELPAPPPAPSGERGG